MRITRRLIVIAAVLGGLFYAANLVAERIAEQRIADEAQKTFATKEKPEVSIEGFPILLKVLGGTIPKVSLSGENLVVQDMSVARLRVQLEGVKVSLGDLSSGNPLSVERGLAEGDVAEAAVNAYLRSRGEKATVDVKDGKIVATGQVRGLGTGRAEGVPKLVGRILSFTPDRVSVGGRPLSGVALQRAREEMKFEVDVPLLPGGVRITAIEYREEGIRLIARMENASVAL